MRRQWDSAWRHYAKWSVALSQVFNGNASSSYVPAAENWIRSLAIDFRFTELMSVFGNHPEVVMTPVAGRTFSRFCTVAIHCHRRASAKKSQDEECWYSKPLRNDAAFESRYTSTSLSQSSCRPTPTAFTSNPRMQPPAAGVMSPTADRRSPCSSGSYCWSTHQTLLLGLSEQGSTSGESTRISRTQDITNP